MKVDYVHKDTLTATDYVELNKNNELLMSYNQALLKENQTLKKQLEELDKKLFFTKNELEMRQKSIDNKLNQQKEFIEWLEDKIKFSTKPTTCVLLKSILRNYKEIIGVSNEKINVL